MAVPALRRVVPDLLVVAGVIVPVVRFPSE